MPGRNIKFYNRVLEFREHMLNSMSLTDFYKNYPSDQSWYYRQKANRKNGYMNVDEIKTMDGCLPGWYDLSEEMFVNVRRIGIMHLSRNEGMRPLEDLMNVVGYENAWIMHIFGFNSIEEVAKIPANLHQQATENPMYGQISRKIHIELSQGSHAVRDALVDSQRLIREKLYPGINTGSLMYYWLYINGDKTCDYVTTHPHMFNFGSLAWYNINKRQVELPDPAEIDRIIQLCNDEQYDLVNRSSFVFNRLYDCFMNPERFEETKTHEEWGIFCKRLAEYYKSCSLSNQSGSVIMSNSSKKQVQGYVSHKKPRRKGLAGLFDMFDR